MVQWFNGTMPSTFQDMLVKVSLGYDHILYIYYILFHSNFDTNCFLFMPYLLKLHLILYFGGMVLSLYSTTTNVSLKWDQDPQTCLSKFHKHNFNLLVECMCMLDEWCLTYKNRFTTKCIEDKWNFIIMIFHNYYYRVLNI